MTINQVGRNRIFSDEYHDGRLYFFLLLGHFSLSRLPPPFYFPPVDRGWKDREREKKKNGPSKWLLMSSPRLPLFFFCFFFGWWRNESDPLFTDFLCFSHDFFLFRRPISDTAHFFLPLSLYRPHWKRTDRRYIEWLTTTGYCFARWPFAPASYTYATSDRNNGPLNKKLKRKRKDYFYFLLLFFPSYFTESRRLSERMGHAGGNRSSRDLLSPLSPSSIHGGTSR